MLSIPFFVILGLLPEVRSGIRTSFTPLYIEDQGINVTAARALAVLLVNLLTQDMCVKGVNRLTTVSSSIMRPFLDCFHRAVMLMPVFLITFSVCHPFQLISS